MGPGIGFVQKVPNVSVLLGSFRLAPKDRIEQQQLLATGNSNVPFPAKLIDES